MIMTYKLYHIHPVQKIWLKISGVHHIGSMGTSVLPWLPNYVYLKTTSQKQCVCCNGIYLEQQRHKLRGHNKKQRKVKCAPKKATFWKIPKAGYSGKSKSIQAEKISGCQGTHGAMGWLSTVLWWPVHVTYLCPVPRMYSPRWLLLWTLDFWSYWCVKVASSIGKDIVSSRDTNN